MTTLFAQPYDISACGFYFESIEQYRTKASTLKNDYGDPVEEFEIQFIDGERIDCTLASAFGVNQANLSRFFDLVDQWDDDQKTRFIIAVGESGYNTDCDPDDLDIDVFELDFSQRAGRAIRRRRLVRRNPRETALLSRHGFDSP